MQTDSAIRQNRKMINVALGNMSHDDFIFQDFNFEVGLWNLLIPLDPEALTGKIKQARDFVLISPVRRPHEEPPAAVFDDLQSERRKIVELEKRKYRIASLRLIVNFQSPFRRHH